MSGAAPSGPALAPPPSTSGSGDAVGSGSKPCKAVATADLTVTVKYQRGSAPVKGVAVSARGASNRSGTTDNAGVVVFRGIKPSPPPYQVSGRKEVATDTKTVVVATGSNTADLILPGPVNPILEPATLVVGVRKHYADMKRTKLVLKTDVPFDGTGTLTRSNDRVRFFTAETGGTEIKFDGTQNAFAGAKLQSAGLTIYGEGARASDKLDDIKLTLTLKGGTSAAGPPAEAKVTSVEVTLDICKSRTRAGVDPAPMSQPPSTAPAPKAPAQDKYYGGRFIHVQDAAKSHGRAMLIIRKAKPEAFTGTLVLTPENAKVDLFEAATGGSAKATPYEIANGTIPKDGKSLWVEGATVSAGLRDTGFRLGIKDASDDMDRARVTVVRFSNLQADIPSSPPLNARMGNSPVARHAYARANDVDPAFDVSPPLVLIGGSVPTNDPVALSVSVTPADVPVEWSVLRDERPAPDGDHADVIKKSPNKVPTLRKVSGQPLQRQLLSDAVGSFHIRPFVDCNGNGKFDHEADVEPFILMNLLLVHVGLHKDDSVAQSANFQASSDGNFGINISGGVFDIANPGAASLHFAARADVIGGGGDGRRGLDRVFAGWVNNEYAEEQIGGDFVDATGAAPVRHHATSIFTSNRASATGAHATGTAFIPGDPAPVLVAPPLLDSGRRNPGTGGDTATLSRSQITSRTDLSVGQRFLVEAVDSPGDFEPGNHLAFANAQLVRFRFGLTFRGNLCFWVNHGLSSGATGDPSDRLYTLLRRYHWTMYGEWDIDVNTGNLTEVKRPRVKISAKKTYKPAEPVRGHHVEVREPTALNLLARDCRT